MHQTTPQRVVAAFDVDGTLTRRDTLIPFLRFLCGPGAVNRSLLRHSARLSMAIALDKAAQRASIKEQVLRDLLLGRRRDDVWTAGERFARRLNQDGMLRTDIVSRLRWHRSEGHDIVLVSASLETYLEPFAQALGGASVLGTKLLVGSDDTLTGEFDGFNCRGAEKLRRLREWGLCSSVELWAYGDSSGDRELLEAAHVSHRVSRGARCTTPPAQERQLS